MSSVPMLVAVVMLVCAVSAAPRPGRIINGIETTTNEHLHQVSLGYGTTGSDWRHFCGGSVIDENWILTAAHCVEGETTEKTRVIVHRDFKDDVYSLEHIVMHPYFGSETTPGAIASDIALLKTLKPIDNAETYIISLPADNYDEFIDANCTITGWGYIKYEDEQGTDAVKLQETWGKILDEAGCSAFWHSDYNHANNICIHNLDSSACMGDSGGPMVCKNMLAGVTSFGNSVCAPHEPAVYTRVSNFLGWINETMSAY